MLQAMQAQAELVLLASAKKGRQEALVGKCNELQGAGATHINQRGETRLGLVLGLALSVRFWQLFAF